MLQEGALRSAIQWQMWLDQDRRARKMPGKFQGIE
jgi:hypothetical protein